MDKCLWSLKKKINEVKHTLQLMENKAIHPLNKQQLEVNCIWADTDDLLHEIKNFLLSFQKSHYFIHIIREIAEGSSTPHNNLEGNSRKKEKKVFWLLVHIVIVSSGKHQGDCKP